jgi:hypothetical protein
MLITEAKITYGKLKAGEIFNLSPEQVNEIVKFIKKNFVYNHFQQA